MLVQEILKLKGNVLYTTHSGASLSEAVAALTEHDAGSLVVMDAGEMTGLTLMRFAKCCRPWVKPRVICQP